MTTPCCRVVHVLTLNAPGLSCCCCQAVGGIDKLKDNVDTLIIIPNDQLLAEVQDRSTSLTDAFKLADTVLLQVGLSG